MGVYKNIKQFTFSLLPDKLYLTLLFHHRFGYWMDWNNPQTYNEKLQWLKIHDRHPEYTRMVDKAAVKDFVAGIIGKEYIIPTLATYDTVDAIDFNALPSQFVLKCTHDSGGIIVCKDKSKLNVEAAKRKLRKALNRTFSLLTREYPYEDVPRRIIAEKYMEDESGYELKDYKFFCFDGKVHYLFVATGRQNNDTRFDFYDKNFRHLPIRQGHPWATNTIDKPANFEKMIEIAEQLSKSIPHVRVDLYNINGKIYFGEYTFFHYGGIVPFQPAEWDFRFGNLLKLPI